MDGAHVKIRNMADYVAFAFLPSGDVFDGAFVEEVRMPAAPTTNGAFFDAKNLSDGAEREDVIWVIPIDHAQVINCGMIFGKHKFNCSWFCLMSLSGGLCCDIAFCVLSQVVAV